MLLLRRQWITHDRLAFPIAELPLQMVAEGTAGPPRTGRLSPKRAFWIGAALSLAIRLETDLADKIPWLPSVPLWVSLAPASNVGPLAALSDLTFLFRPSLIALAYLVPADLSFSCWFFYLLRLALTVLAIVFGAEPQSASSWWGADFPAPYFQAGGAVVFLAGGVFWAARHHIGRAVRVATGRIGGDGEAWLWRYVLVGLILSVAFMLWFCWMAGCRLLFAAALVCAILAYHVVWARLRAETGLGGFLTFPMPLSTAAVSVGTANLRPQEIIAMAATQWAHWPGAAEAYDTGTQTSMEAFKIADASGLPLRRLLPAIVVGFILMLGVGTFVVLTGTYHYGFLNLKMGRDLLSPMLTSQAESVALWVREPTSFDASPIPAAASGYLVAMGLTLLRLRFAWWQLHPFGYLAANTWVMLYLWGPFFAGWLLKVLATRYGGLRLYRSTVPLAVGILMGEVLEAGVWAGVSLLTGGEIVR